MSKFVSIIAGAGEIVTVAFAIATGQAALGALLIAAGAGSVIAGIGTLLSKGPIQGFATTVRNPVHPWEVIYGLIRTGGAEVFSNFWPQPGNSAGGNDQML